MNMVEAISRNLKECVTPGLNLHIIALNTTCPDGDLYFEPMIK